MKLTVLLTLAALALPGFSVPFMRRQSGAPDAATITQLAPPLGFTAGLNPTGSGDCDGAVNGSNGKPIKVPCSCPPAPDVYVAVCFTRFSSPPLSTVVLTPRFQALIKNVQAGFAVNNPTVKVSFPTGDSKQDKSARINAAAITIQNLDGPGKGCPFASTKLGALQQAVNDGTDVTPATPTTSSAVSPPPTTSPDVSPPPACPPPASSPPSSPPANNPPAVTPTTNTTPVNGSSDAATITKLAPPLGFHSGVNPTGTGDCDGAINGADGKPIKIPCSCPPPQDEYIAVSSIQGTLGCHCDIDKSFLQQLIANVQAGKALNNPTVHVSFPTGNSKADQSARLNAAAVTLQNLNGPGKGCPVVSTTFPLQQKTIDAESG